MDSTVQQVWAFTFRVTGAGFSLCSDDSLEQTDTAELLDWDCFYLTDIFPVRKETVNQTVCWIRPDQLCVSPTTSLLLLWPQTWSYSSKSIIKTWPSQQCSRKTFHQHEQFYFLSRADSPHCGGTCLCSHLCLEITTAQEHGRIFLHIRCLKVLPIILFSQLYPLVYFCQASACHARRLHSEKDTYSQSSCFC